MVILLFLLLSLLGESVFSSIPENARSKIEEINTILDKPISLTLSNFLSKPGNWTKFSEVFKEDDNLDWIHTLSNRFYTSVMKLLYSYQVPGVTENYNYPSPVAAYRKSLEDLHGFYFDPRKIDDFFQLWINTLNHLNILHGIHTKILCGEEKDKKILKCVNFLSLPTAVKVSSGLLNALKNQLDDVGFPQDCDKKFFDKLKDAVDGKVPEPEDTSGGPASVPDKSLNSSSQIGGNGSEPKDTSNELFSSNFENVRPQIEEINEIIGDTPTTSALSIFLRDTKNWRMFSEALKNGENGKWLLDLGSLFDYNVYPSLISPISNPESGDNPLPIKKFEDNLQKFKILTSYPNNFANFLPLWVDILYYLQFLNSKKEEIEALKFLPQE